MHEPRTPPEVPHPPPPWRARGQMWMGVYQTDGLPPLPDGLRPLLGERDLAVTLVRYLEGTLRYDELVFGALARRGARIGLFVHEIWVDDAASLWGGRRIWGLRKEMASFTWDDDTVHVRDDGGDIATLTVDRRRPFSPTIWMPTPGFGQPDGRLAHFIAGMWCRLGGARMRVDAFSPRFPYRAEGAPRLGFTANPFRITVPAPTMID